MCVPASSPRCQPITACRVPAASTRCGRPSRLSTLESRLSTHVGRGLGSDDLFQPPQSSPQRLFKRSRGSRSAWRLWPLCQSVMSPGPGQRRRSGDCLLTAHCAQHSVGQLGDSTGIAGARCVAPRPPSRPPPRPQPPVLTLASTRMAASPRPLLEPWSVGAPSSSSLCSSASAAVAKPSSSPLRHPLPASTSTIPSKPDDFILLHPYDVSYISFSTPFGFVHDSGQWALHASELAQSGREPTPCLVTEARRLFVGCSAATVASGQSSNASQQRLLGNRQASTGSVARLAVESHGVARAQLASVSGQCLQQPCSPRRGPGRGQGKVS